MPATLAETAIGQRPADLEAVSVLMAFIPGDHHTGRQVDLDRHTGHGACPVRWRGAVRGSSPKTFLGKTGMITPGRLSGQTPRKPVTSHFSARAQVPDARLRHRRRRATAVGRGRGADRGEPALVPGRPRRGGLPAGPVRVQRHVEALPQRDRRAAGPGGPRAGPVPRHAEVRQGARRDPCGGGQAAEAGRLRAGLEAVAVVLPEAAGEPDGRSRR